MAANSALTFMLSPRTLRDASASRWVRSRDCVSRFMRSTARRMYAARDSFSATAQRLLASSRSSGSLREMALIGMPLEHLYRVCKYDIRVPRRWSTTRSETREGSESFQSTYEPAKRRYFERGARKGRQDVGAASTPSKRHGTR